MRDGRPTLRLSFLKRARRTAMCVALAAGALASGGACCQAQGALLLEQPYGFFGTVNPTGHSALYFARICAETPVKLRRCEASEQGAVLGKYEGIDGYEWLAIPLLPYLYSVEAAGDVPARADRAMVTGLRNRYRASRLQSLGPNVSTGNLIHGGWTELEGIAYERRTYAFWFDTTAEQDDALIARLDHDPNHTHFHMFTDNCADFVRVLLNGYFPNGFERSLLPDLGVTTPKQIATMLRRYGRRHPETRLTVFEIPQVPGSRRRSISNKSIAESLITTPYAIPIVFASPYLAGGLVVDYFARGGFHAVPKNPQILTPGDLMALTGNSFAAQNAGSAGAQVPSAAGSGIPGTGVSATAQSGLKGIKDLHE